MDGKTAGDRPLLAKLPRSAIDLAGAQLGDLRMGDVVAGDSYKLHFDAGGGTIVVNMGDAAHPRAIAVGGSAGGTLVLPGELPALERLPVRTTPPAMIAGFRDRADPLAALAALGPGAARWLRGPAGCGLSALLRQSARQIALPPDGVVLLDATAEAAGSRADDLLQALAERFYRQSARKLLPVELPSHLASLRALVLLDHLPPLSADELERIGDALAGCLVLIGGQGSAPATVEELRLPPLPPADALALLSPAAPAPADRAPLEALGAALAPSPLALDLARRLLETGSFTPRHLAAALGAPLREPLSSVAECALVSLSADERQALAAIVHGCGPNQRLEDLATATGRAPASLEQPLEQLGELGLVSGAGVYQVRTRSLRRALAALLPAREERKAAVLAWASAAAAHAGDQTWLAQHRAHLMEAVAGLRELGDPQRAGALARQLAPALVVTGRWDAWGALLDETIVAAGAGGDEPLRAWALHERGTRAGLTGRPDQAAADLKQAETLREALADRYGAAVSRNNRELLTSLLAPDPRPRDEAALEPEGGASPGRPWWPLLLGLTLVAGALLGLWLLVRPAPGDGPQAGATAVVTPDVGPQDGSIAVETREDEPLALERAALLKAAGDPGGSSGELRILPTGPSERGATLALTGAGDLRYTPPPDASGADRFTLTVEDRAGRRAELRVSVTILAVNDPPLTVDLALDAREDEPLPLGRELLLRDVADVEDDAAGLALELALPVPTSERGGTVSIDQTGGLVYTPPPNYSGPDAFGFLVRDSDGAGTGAIVELVVEPVNDAPVAADDRYTLQSGQSRVLTLQLEAGELLANDRDPDGDGLELADVVAVSARGVKVVWDPAKGALSYATAQQTAAQDSFAYTVCDPAGLCDEGQVLIEVVDGVGPEVIASAGIPECDPRTARFIAQASDSAGVAGVTLVYRLVRGNVPGAWQELKMILEGDRYTAEVALPQGFGVEYAIVAVDGLGNQSRREFGRVTQTFLC